MVEGAKAAYIVVEQDEACLVSSVHDIVDLELRTSVTCLAVGIVAMDVIDAKSDYEVNSANRQWFSISPQSESGQV